MNYIQSLKQVNTLSELESLKENFLCECSKREKKIKVSNMLANIVDMNSANQIFETISPFLISKNEGKNIINKYTKTIKENRSLKTIYSCCVGLNESLNEEKKRGFISEALTLNPYFDYNEYTKGISDIVKIVSEGFNILGDEFILNNVKECDIDKSICESLIYLITTKKTLKNLNEHIYHVDKLIGVNNITNNDINVDLSLNEVVNEMTNNKVNIEDIFEAEDKEQIFSKVKTVCLEMISNQKNKTKDTDIVNSLVEMEEKLNKKQYTFETFTKDMLYMNELQEVLK